MAPRRQHGSGRAGTVQGDQRGLPGPVRPGSPVALRHRSDGRAPAAPAGRASTSAFGGFSDIFDAFFGGGAVPRRPGAAVRSPVRTCATTCGSPSRRRSRHREGDRVHRLQTCETCHGTGAKPGTEPITCPQCNGRGEVRSFARRCSARWSTSAPARGAMARARSSRRRCHTCQGEGRLEHKRTLRVTIPAGIDEGHQIRLSNEGEVGPRGGPAGILYVAVHVQPHKSLTPRGHRALSTWRPSRSPRRRSGRRSRSRPSTATEEVEIKPGTQPGTEIRLRGKGVPHLRRAGQRGDLHVMVDVVVPTKLSKKAKRAADRLRRRDQGDGRRTAAACSRRLGL